MCIHSSVKNKNSVIGVIRVIFLTFSPVFFKKFKSKRIRANISTVVISSDGIVGRLHFFFTFLFSEKVWNIEHMDHKWENQRPFPLSLVVIHRRVEAPSVSFQLLFADGAGEPGNSFIHTANICWIPISQALQGDSYLSAFYGVFWSPQYQQREPAGGGAKPTFVKLPLHWNYLGWIHRSGVGSETPEEQVSYFMCTGFTQDFWVFSHLCTISILYLLCAWFPFHRCLKEKHMRYGGRGTS